MAVTITEWNKETKSLVTQDYPPPPVQYIDITADNWMQYWGQEVEVWNASEQPKEKRLVGWSSYSCPICPCSGIQHFDTWEHARIKAPTDPYYYLKDEDVIKEGDQRL